MSNVYAEYKMYSNYVEKTVIARVNLSYFVFSQTRSLSMARHFRVLPPKCWQYSLGPWAQVKIYLTV